MVFLRVLLAPEGLIPSTRGSSYTQPCLTRPHDGTCDADRTTRFWASERRSVLQQALPAALHGRFSSKLFHLLARVDLRSRSLGSLSARRAKFTRLAKITAFIPAGLQPLGAWGPSPALPLLPHLLTALTRVSRALGGGPWTPSA